MDVKDVVGIDVGKKENEARIHSSQEVLTFENNKNGFKKLIGWVCKKSKLDIKQILFVFEHTGLYCCQVWN